MMGDSEMVGPPTAPVEDEHQQEAHTSSSSSSKKGSKKKHHKSDDGKRKEKRKEDAEGEEGEGHSTNDGKGVHHKKEHHKKSKTEEEAKEEREEEEEELVHEEKKTKTKTKEESDGDEDDDDEDEEEEDDGKVEEEVIPVEEQRTTGAKERQRRGTVSLYDMVAAEGNTIRRGQDSAAATKSEDDEDSGSSGRRAKTKANANAKTKAKSDEKDDDSSDEEKEEEMANENESGGSDHLKVSGDNDLGKKLDAGGSTKDGKEKPKHKDKDKEQREKEKEERERERKKEKELVKEKKEKERKEREEKEKEERERKEKEKKEKMKEKERKREEKEKKKKKEKEERKAAKATLSTKEKQQLDTSDSSDSLGGTQKEHNSQQLEGRRSSGNEDEVHAALDDDIDDDNEDHGPGSPQARYKEMMSQKYANVCNDVNGYRAHMTTNYFTKLAEQRRIKRSREEALKKIKLLSQKDYQTVKKAHERLLKEAREARRRRLKEAGPGAGKGRTGGLHTVASDLGPGMVDKKEDGAGVESGKKQGESGGEGRKDGSAKLGGSGRRSKFTKKYANSMPDMDRKAIKAGLKDAEAEVKEKVKKRKEKHVEEVEEGVEDQQGSEQENEEGGHKDKGDDNHGKDDLAEKSEGEGSEGKLQSSNSAPKTSASPVLGIKKSKDKDKDSAPIDPEEFFNELYAICWEDEPAPNEVEKYLSIGRLLRDHELHKQEREQRLKRMIGLQTPENGSPLWKESEEIFKKPLSSFVCHRDFARLVRKYQIERPAGEILCGPFENLELPKTEATYTVLVTLAMALDDTTLSERIQTNFRLGDYFREDDDLNDPTGLKVFFEEVIGEHTPLLRILKVTSQSIVAPCITKLKACMAPLDFNSVRNSWSIAIAVDSEEVTVVHTKKETATPDSEEKYGPFTFEWGIEYVFDLEMTSLKYLRPMLMNVRGSKKSRKVLKKAYTQLVSVKAK